MESPVSRSKESSKSKTKSSSSSTSKRRHHSSSDDERNNHYHSSSKRRNHSSDESDRHRHSSDSEHEDRKKSSSHKKSKKHVSSKSKESQEITTNSASGDLSLSIEETNKLRAKLGLKPLALDESKPTSNSTTTSDDKSKSGKKTYIDKDTNQEFEHVPAKNIAEIREQKEFKKKLEEQKEKRRLAEKIKKVKGIAEESDEDEETTDIWIQKLKEKQEAARKAKLLEEMDEQFETNATVETKQMKTKKEYTSSHLKGLRVEHDQSKFQEGEEIILTLKDKNIIKGIGENLELDEDDEGDVLVNVNLIDQENAEKNIENKKKRPDYNPYDDFDEDGNFNQKSLLNKYDEELNGEQKKSFKLGAKGVYDTSDEKFLKKLDQDHKARAIRLDLLNDLKVTSDYMTQAEMEKFKKPKKIRKVMRKTKMLKADDLLPLQNEIKQEETSFKSKIKRETDTQESSIETSTSTNLTGNHQQTDQKKVSLKNIDFGFKNESENSSSSSDEGEIRDDDESNEDDNIDVDKLNKEKLDDLKQILDEENQVLEELHTVLSKTRKKVTESILNNHIYENIKQEIDMEPSTSSVTLDNLNTIKEESDALTLDIMSEFCRNIGSEKLDRVKKETIEDEDIEFKTSKHKEQSSSESSSEDLSDMEIEQDEKSKSKIQESDDENVAILDEEPIIDRGIGSALKLAVNKGYLAKEKDKQNARLTKSNIQAENYTIEERNYYDIDDKYNRNRDKYSGPLSEFEEKKGYKPDIKLDYFDEKGHAMNEKEAFRYLSHKFHGKGPGKKKTEKRLVKVKESEAMQKMSSVDTPLNTVALLMEKQKRLQQPYVVLSTQKGKQDQVTLHKR